MKMKYILRAGTMLGFLMTSTLLFSQSHGLANNQVALSTAKNDIKIYSLWWHGIPLTATWDQTSNTLSYPDRQLDPHKSADSALIPLLNSYANGQNHISLSVLPPNSNSGIAYFISIRDIAMALGLDTLAVDTLAYNGIRVYPAIHLDATASNDVTLTKAQIDGLNTHLYVVPTNGSDSDPQDYIPEKNQEKFVYDLTAPCPKTCDTASPLYKASFKLDDPD